MHVCGWHQGLAAGAFNAYRIGRRRVVFRESLTGSTITDRPEEVTAHVHACEHLRARAASPAASLDLIDSARSALCLELRNSWSG
ncbi:Scr1 family TA system antitoxin-like transcriptional regulator [Streptomyces sp. NPDC048479]|uniref:Scr1 family TA system antitoxin-like transcriptional regulator n=1 Tax=Streptomyces sp. NPDC048479 TaxID=3154725 RepID=UPI0034206487